MLANAVVGAAQLHLATAVPAVAGGGQLSVKGGAMLQVQVAATSGKLP
jgi:hypothetical protein